MFHRLYLLLGIVALMAFSVGQYRGKSPFDVFADTASNSPRSGSSHTYHK